MRAVVPDLGHGGEMPPSQRAHVKMDGVGLTAECECISHRKDQQQCTPYTSSRLCLGRFHFAMVTYFLLNNVLKSILSPSLMISLFQEEKS